MKRTLAAIVILFCLAAPAFGAAPVRLVSLAPNIREILYDLGLEDRVVAVTDYCDYPPAVKAKPRVGVFTGAPVFRSVQHPTLPSQIPI